MQAWQAKEKHYSTNELWDKKPSSKQESMPTATQLPKTDIDPTKIIPSPQIRNEYHKNKMARRERCEPNKSRNRLRSIWNLGNPTKNIREYID